MLIKFGDVIYADDKMIPCVKDENSLKKTVDYLQTGDVIFADTAEDDSVGKATEILNPNNTAVVSGLHTIPCRPNYAFVPSYLGYYMNSKAFHDQLYPFMQGIKVTSISKGNIGKTVISYPHLSEQKKIADLLMLLSERIEKQRLLVEALKSYKRGALSKLFPKKGESAPQYRFAGFTKPWTQRKLGEVGKARSGVGFPDTEQGGKVGFPFFKVSDMNNVGNESEMTTANNYVTDEQIASHRWRLIKDLPAIFFAKVGAAVMLNRKRLCLSPFLLDNNTMAYSLNPKAWNADFAKALFETIDLTSLVQVGALPSYNTGDLEVLEISLPELKEQEQIGAFFLSLDNLITLHQCELNEFQESKSGLLQQLFI